MFEGIKSFHIVTLFSIFSDAFLRNFRQNGQQFCPPGFLKSQLNIFSRKFPLFSERNDNYKFRNVEHLKEKEIFTNKSIKIYCLSDLHADSPKNLEYIKSDKIRPDSNDQHIDDSLRNTWSSQSQNMLESSTAYSVLICPGDVGSDISVIREVFKSLASKYDLVCYVPGNHEAWLRRNLSLESNNPNGIQDIKNSLEKIDKILEIANEYNICIGSVRISSIKSDLSNTGVMNIPNKSKKIEIPLNNNINNNNENNNVDIYNSQFNIQENIKRSVKIFPLYSWYHPSFDTEPEFNNSYFLEINDRYPFQRRWGDFSLCHWPEDVVEDAAFKTIDIHHDNKTLAKYFGNMNEESIHNYLKECASTHQSEIETETLRIKEDSPLVNINENPLKIAELPSPSSHSARSSVSKCSNDTRLGDKDDVVLTFSHFLPRQELCPEKRFIREPHLTRVIGSDILEHQIRRLRPHIHMFGHTHIPIDMTLEGQRYLQWCLGYPKEALKQCGDVHKHGPLLVYDSSLGAGSEGIPRRMLSEEAIWSKYYEGNERDPMNMVPSPWLLKSLDVFGSRLNETNPLVKLIEDVSNHRYSRNSEAGVSDLLH